MAKQDALDSLKQDPQAAALLSDPKALSALLGSKEARTVASLLQQVGQGQLQTAAQAAISGSPEALNHILEQVSGSADGQAAIAALEKKGKR